MPDRPIARPDEPQTLPRAPESAPDAARPVILTVDDDPGVSRAVARDLRRRYGRDYRILRTESGAQALEALREVALRGSHVAVLLADHRMPEMNGVEFSRQRWTCFRGPAGYC